MVGVGEVEDCVDALLDEPSLGERVVGSRGSLI